ncbi:GMC oxidoreductase [Roseibium sp.]|uniref:GMC oxidoreductase n=2 Tax=Roseibium sp. TaxID=1936156 RepID=UPI003265DB32
MQFDILIVGAGMSAGPVIEHFATVAPQTRIAILDRGGRGNLREKRSIRFAREGTFREADQWWTCGLPGGAANLWYGQLSRFQGPDFLELPEDRNGPIECWPIGQPELTPYYDSIERRLRPYCADHLLRGRNAPADAGLVTPRNRVSTFEKMTFDLLRTQGWDPYCGATCLGGHGWSSAPVDPVTLHGRDPASANSHMKNWVFRTAATVRAMDNVSYFEDRSVEKIIPAPGGYRLECINRSGCRSDFFSNRIVLASGVTSTVPLLATMPDIDRTLLGRKFTLTNELTAYIDTDIPRDSVPDQQIGRFANVSSRRLYAPSDFHPHLGGKISLYDARSFEGDARHAEKLRRLRRLDRSIGTLSPDRVTLKVSFKGTSEPSENKFIKTDPTGRPVLHYKPTGQDEALIEYVERQVRGLAENLPGARLLGLSDNVRGADVSSAHLHGGAVLGTDPRTSLLTQDCEVRAAPGVFVVDASFMPGSGGTNSSHTILANSLRVATVVASRMAHEKTSADAQGGTPRR